MTAWLYVLLLAAGLALVFIACLAPERFFRWIGIMAVNTATGLALLFLVNLCSGLTGVALPFNGAALAVSSLLGAPGVACLTALAAV